MQNQTEEHLLNHCIPKDTCDGHTEVHNGPSNIDEPNRDDEPNPEPNRELTICEQWKKELISESIGSSFPAFTFSLAIILLVIHIYVNPRNRPWLYDYLMLDCFAINNEAYPQLSHRLISYNFVHAHTDHLLHNELALLLFGIPFEKIFGTNIFFFSYFYLCYSIPIEWYEEKLANGVETCNRADTVVGASGVIFALGLIAVVVTFVRLCRQVLFQKVFPKVSESVAKEKQTQIIIQYKGIFITWNFVFYFLSFVVNLATVIYQYLTDKLNAEKGVANDIHLIGIEKGIYPSLILSLFCLFDPAGSFFRVTFQRLVEKCQSLFTKFANQKLYIFHYNS